MKREEKGKKHNEETERTVEVRVWLNKRLNRQIPPLSRESFILHRSSLLQELQLFPIMCQ